MEYYGFVLGELEPGRQAADTFEQILRMTDIAERCLLDGWFTAEHHGKPAFSVVPSPNLLLAAASQRTRRLRLGVLVTVLPYHHPLRAAEEIRMLDALTGGRIEIGVGRGAIRTEQLAYGIDRQRTAEMFDAELGIFLDLLHNNHASWDTEWWKGEIADLVPAAVQTPCPPIWMATVSRNSITRAATLGTHAATALAPLDTAMRYRDSYHEQWAQLQPGKPVGKFSHAVTIAIGETRDEAKKYAFDPLNVNAQRFLAQLSDRPVGNDPAYADHERGWREFVDSSFTEMIDRGMVIYGSVEDAREQLERIITAGPDVLTITPQFTGLDYEFAQRSLELFATEVAAKTDPAWSARS